MADGGDIRDAIENGSPPGDVDTYYHATNSSFSTPRPSYDPYMAMGSGYYITKSMPYMEKILGEWSRPGDSPQVRIVSVPKDIKIANQEDVDRVVDKLGLNNRPPFFVSNLLEYKNNAINSQLQAEGFGGRTQRGLVPSFSGKEGDDDTEDSEETVIFPEYMDKIYNKLSGKIGGWNDLGLGKDLQSGSTKSPAPDTKVPTIGFTPKDPSDAPSEGFSPLTGFLSGLTSPGGFTPGIKIPTIGFTPIPDFVKYLIGGGNQSNATSV